MILVRIILISVLISPFVPVMAFAGGNGEYSTVKLHEAMMLVKGILDEHQRRNFEFMKELRQLEPTGPEFVDQTLALIAAIPTGWRAPADGRAKLLYLLSAVAEGSREWTNFEGSRIKESIHQSAQSLLARFPNTTRWQVELLRIFDKLNLWDESDLPFLTRKFFIRGGWYRPNTELLIRLLERAPEEQREEFAHLIRGKLRSDLLPYLLLYRIGQMRDNELLRLFRLFMGEIRAHGDFNIENFEDKALYQFVLSDLHNRLTKGDSAMLEAFEKIKASPNFGGRRSVDTQPMKQFLNDLETGKLLRNCESQVS